ncbi:MerC domain-containing protein [Methylophaga sp. OBS4]|uniref:MerC domain-containing protein n=1 Tax=Methylophaga sp. OBS4 TaxID=2991935 RepID=UPI00224EE231|nr:MerC domain-containing protein [Methylophaga sp. OBS4]MCX4186974.1 MerC domain-containing protein [Methylophaga sp. OBS4]
MKDKLGMACTGVCMIHCLITPVLLTLGATGLFWEVLQSERVHQVLVFPVVLIASLSFPFSYLKHRVLLPSLLGGGGAFLIVMAVFAGEENEFVMTVTGGMLLLMAHGWNHALNKRFNRPVLAQERTSS